MSAGAWSPTCLGLPNQCCVLSVGAVFSCFDVSWASVCRAAARYCTCYMLSDFNMSRTLRVRERSPSCRALDKTRGAGLASPNGRRAGQSERRREEVGRRAGMAPLQKFAKDLKNDAAILPQLTTGKRPSELWLIPRSGRTQKACFLGVFISTNDRPAYGAA